MERLIKKLDNKLKIIKSEENNNIITIYAKRTNKTAICPCCSKTSSSINTRYYRTVKDLPIQEAKVILKLEAKTFFCNNEKCKINTFAETFDFIERRSRMTTKLKNRIIDDSKGMSARAAKVSINKGLTDVSDDTILRLLKKNNTNSKKR